MVFVIISKIKLLRTKNIVNYFPLVSSFTLSNEDNNFSLNVNSVDTYAMNQLVS